MNRIQKKKGAEIDQTQIINVTVSEANDKKVFVNHKSNSALLYNKGYNLLTSAFPPKLVQLKKFPMYATH